MAMELDGFVILVAEDEVLIGMDLIAQLEEAGSAVIGPALTVGDALELTDFQVFDAAVLDVVLGHDLVYPFADILSDRGIPFIFASGIGANNLPPKYAGTPVCEKPFTSGSIIGAISNVMRGTRRRGAA